jgi:uncharacterized protein YpmB
MDGLVPTLLEHRPIYSPYDEHILLINVYAYAYIIIITIVIIIVIIIAIIIIIIILTLLAGNYLHANTNKVQQHGKGVHLQLAQSIKCNDYFHTKSNKYCVENNGGKVNNTVRSIT